jgi:exodeoxyribonuclease-1
MAQTFFFYDLETSGFSAQHDRIMQFAGQRTNLNLEPIGEPYNILVRLADDTLPSPDALLVTGITPQQTIADGVNEAEFARILMEEVFTPNTIAVGFNNIHFDDEFIRHLFWRNFYDPYEWTWKDGRSRWDLMDVVRMTRALRPEGIEWPVVDGKEVNRLADLTKANGIDHYKAHDALSDVEATMAVARLIKDKQPQLYEYLFKIRDKNEVKRLVNLDDKQPFVYVSGRFSSDFHKATVAFPLTSGRNGNVIVYDLRHDPSEFVGLTPKELAARLFASWEARHEEGFVQIPVKEMQYNRAPAVAPLGVLEQSDGWQRVGIDEATITAHKKALLEHPEFAENVRSVFEGRPEYARSKDPEAQLYDGFVTDADTLAIQRIRQASMETLADFHPEFTDERLSPLLLHYKARNFPRSLSEDEVGQWESWRAARLNAQLPEFVKRLQALAGSAVNDDQQFILQELQLWAESILPLE